MRATILLTLMLLVTTIAFGSPSFEQNATISRAKLLASSPTSVKISYDLAEINPETVEIEGAELSSFSLPGEGVIVQNGMPALPGISRYVVIPPKSAVELIVTEDGTPRRTRAENPPLLTNEPSIGEPTVFPNEGGLFPPNMAELSEPIVVRGVRCVLVTIYPIQYDLNSGEYVHHQNLQAEVRPCDGEVINPVIFPERRGRSREFLKMISLFAINGDEVGRDDPDRDALPRYNGHYLVIAHESLLRFAGTFIEWRRKAGYKVDLLSVPNGNATDDSWILARIREKYNAYLNAGQDPFEYVLTIGDRSGYYEMGNPGAVLESPQGANVFGAKHGDWLYGCVEGNDEVPDIATGRWPGGNSDLVGLMVGRTLAYEATPDMEDPSWFTRGGAVSQHWGNSQETAYHVTNPSMVRWGESVLRNLNYRDIRTHELLNWDQYGRESGPVFRRLLNDGANAVLARSENYFWCTRNPQRNYFDQDIQTNTSFPFRLNASGHGEWSAEMEFRTGSTNQLRGWVAVTFSWNGPLTGASTSLWSDEVQAVMLHDLPLGWGYSYAQAHIPANIHNDGMMPYYRTDHNFFGDPGLKHWRGVPREVEIEGPASISTKTRLVEVVVHQPDSDTPVANAIVSFYAPGNIPAFDNAGYATYTRMWVKNTRSDADGIARVVLESTDTLINQTNLFVTVTGPDIVPCFHQARIGAQNSLVELRTVGYQEEQGNGDERLNPGEAFSVSLSAQNLGQDVAPGTVATISTFSEYIEVIGENTITFDDIAAGETNAGNSSVVLSILPHCPDALARPVLKPSIKVEFTSDDNVWKSAFNLDVWAPHLEFRSVVGGIEIPDSATSINVEIANIGRVNSGAIAVDLHSMGQGVTVIDGSSTFPAIVPGRTARLDGGPFDISGNKVVVPGSRSPLYMVFATESGFVDTSFFELQIMHPRTRAPIGPDKYGYICFDNTDTLWDNAPVYDWEEINPNDQQCEFEGSALNFRGQSERDLGEAIVVPLGFTTQFYGREFDTITVASNGFITMGNHPRMTNHHNYPLDSGIGGVGMIAPFWDDLRFNQNSRILIYRDREDSRTIVEWHRLRPATGDADLTFQAILYDKDVWITQSGDPNILIQYKAVRDSIENIRNGDAAETTNNPYASAGICSPTGETGINYMSFNRYAVGAAPLEPNRALLFSTSVKFRAGILYGRVTDAATGEGIPGATVYTKHGFVATTEDDGYWRIAEALADILFDITAHKQGYNDSTFLADVDSLIIPEGDSLEINFDLLHPEFSPSTYDLSARLDPNRSIDIGFSLFNSGNGPMDWTADKRLLGDANAEPWQLRRAYNVSDTVEDLRIEGVLFAQEMFFLSGANEAANVDDNLIYKLDRDGALIDTFLQTGSSRYGYKDMDWDGEYIWAVGQDSVYALTTWGEVAIRWALPMQNPAPYIAYNSDDGILYISGTTSNIFRFDRDGNRLEGDLDNLELKTYGLSYWPEDPDGHNLYILNKPSNIENRTVVTKMDVNTGDTLSAFEIPQQEGSTGQIGGWITNEFDVYSWVFMSLQNVSANGGGDKLQIHQLDARKDWMNLDVWGGRLETGETQELVLTLNSAALPDTLFQGEIFFVHNADSGVAHIAISLDVIGPERPSNFDLLTPVDGDTLRALPSRADSLRLAELRFSWMPSFDANFDDNVTYIHCLQTGDQKVSFAVADTANTLSLDTLDLPLWFDTPLIWWVQAVSGQDTVESNARFTLQIVPNSLDPVEVIPVEFGLQSAFPNPFNGRTAIRFGADLRQQTTLIAYDLAGREAARLFDAVPEVGYHTVAWNADRLPTGIYVLQLKSAGRTRVAKLALIK